MGKGRGGGELTKLFARFALDQTHSKHTNILQRTVLHKAGNYVSSIVREGEGVEQSREQRKVAETAGAGGEGRVCSWQGCHHPQSLSIRQTCKGGWKRKGQRGVSWGGDEQGLEKRGQTQLACLANPPSPDFAAAYAIS